LQPSSLSGLLDTNVEVVCADASGLPFEDDLFSSVLMFTMLHHVPTTTLQNCVFKELCRVLRPGGLLVGSDSIDTRARRELHVGDIYNPVDPETIPERLREAGFVDISLEGAHKELYERFYFWARAPKAWTGSSHVRLRTRRTSNRQKLQSSAVG
jgi:SAM-dependent methyltransferase